MTDDPGARVAGLNPMEVETLRSAPALASVFAKAAAGARRRRGSELPHRMLELPGKTIDRERLVDYQRLCGFAVGDVVPHTYPHVLGFPLQAALMAKDDFPLPLVGLVHLHNTITVHRRLTAEDRLDIAVSATRLRPHPKGTLVDLVTEVDSAGERVWEGCSTYLHRGKGDPDAPTGVPSPALPTGPAGAVWRLPEGLGRSYGAVSGDVNPIHLHALSAKAMGFKRAIAHGMWTYARTLAALGGRSSEPSTSRVWFAKPVFLPGAVELVVDRGGARTVAGLRGHRRPEVEHLALTFEAR
ncbi:MaoC/PaaZ C-terminal domain-containing protein [Actinomycetota bacterium]